MIYHYDHYQLNDIIISINEDDMIYIKKKIWPQKIHVLETIILLIDTRLHNSIIWSL